MKTPTLCDYPLLLGSGPARTAREQAVRRETLRRVIWMVAAALFLAALVARASAREIAGAGLYIDLSVMPRTGGGGGLESVATEPAAAGGQGNLERAARGNAEICGDGAAQVSKPTKYEKDSITGTR